MAYRSFGRFRQASTHLDTPPFSQSHHPVSAIAPRVIPVILRPCRWQRTLLGSLQAVPKDGKLVSEWPNHDAAFDEIAAAIERTIADLQQQRRRAGEQAQQQTQEARKRVEAKARQAAEEQQRDAQQRRSRTRHGE